MSILRRAALLLPLALAAVPGAAAAQAPDSLLAASYQGNSRFRVNIDGGLVVTGVFDGDGSLTGAPASGTGTRMMWYPRKGAFRAGQITGTQWDAANIGNHSVAMGLDARASGDYAVALGLRATAANASSVAMGEDVTATGFASVALGYRAHTNTKRGSFVFSDNIGGGVPDSLRAELPAQALWRLSCGMMIYTNQAKTAGVAFGGPTQNPTVCTNGPTTYFGQADAMISTSTGAYLHEDGVWTNVSDVNRKHLFEDVAGEDVLTRLRWMPVRSWSYRTNETGSRHLGPTAQDFHAAFGLGSDDRTIGTVDADGVALAAAKALEARTAEQAAEIRTLRAENEALQRALADLARRVEAIEAAKPKP